jgi:hypothetical protein
MDLLKFKNLSKTKQQQVCRDILYREKYSDSHTVLSGEDYTDGRIVGGAALARRILEILKDISL